MTVGTVLGVAMSELDPDLITALEDMMLADRADRGPFYRAAAEAIVNFRRSFTGADGLPDWNASTPAYRAAIRQAYRAAGVPSESEDASLLAALRHHIGAVTRSVAPAADLAALGRNPKGPGVRPQAAAPTVKVTVPRPIPVGDRPDPIALVTQAIRSLEAAKELKPTGLAAETVRILLRSVHDAVTDLAESIA